MTSIMHPASHPAAFYGQRQLQAGGQAGQFGLRTRRSPKRLCYSQILGRAPANSWPHRASRDPGSGSGPAPASAASGGPLPAVPRRGLPPDPQNTDHDVLAPARPAPERAGAVHRRGPGAGGARRRGRVAPRVLRGPGVPRGAGRGGRRASRGARRGAAEARRGPRAHGAAAARRRRRRVDFRRVHRGDGPRPGRRGRGLARQRAHRPHQHRRGRGARPRAARDARGVAGLRVRGRAERRGRRRGEARRFAHGPGEHRAGRGDPRPEALPRRAGDVAGQARGHEAVLGEPAERGLPGARAAGDAGAPEHRPAPRGVADAAAAARARARALRRRHARDAHVAAPGAGARGAEVAQLRAAPRRGARLPPRPAARDHPPRREAVEHPHRRRRPGQARGLRARKTLPGVQRQRHVHDDGHDGHVPLHGAGGLPRGALLGAARESDIPNFKGSYLGRSPLVSADFWTGDHLSERSRSVDAFPGTRARGTLTLQRR